MAPSTLTRKNKPSCSRFAPPGARFWSKITPLFGFFCPRTQHAKRSEERTVCAGRCIHLLACSRRRAIELRIVPANTGWHAGLAGPFILYEFESQDTVLYLEHYRTGVFTPDEDDVRAYQQAVTTLERLALSETDTRRFLETLT